jgi:hypothetical protein
MKEEFLDYLVLIEKTLASFYEQIKDQSDFSRIRAVLEFMETHSAEHAERIEELKAEHARPEIDDNLILNVHNNISKNVKKEIKDERDLSIILKKLADSEEAIGDMYKRISQHLLKLSDHYKIISSEITRIADDEYNHRDILLNDREQLIKKKK